MQDRKSRPNIFIRLLCQAAKSFNLLLIFLLTSFQTSNKASTDPRQSVAPTQRTTALDPIPPCLPRATATVPNSCAPTHTLHRLIFLLLDHSHQHTNLL